MLLALLQVALYLRRIRRLVGLTFQYAHKGQGFGNILIADDHPMFRDILAEALGRAYPNAKIHSVDCFTDAINLAKEQGPIDLFVLDLLFPGMNGEASVSYIRNAFPQASIVIITMWEDHRVAKRIIDAGADGFLGKGLPARAMLENLERVRAGDFVVNISQRNSIGSPLAFSESLQLTPRQIEILKYLQKQMQNKSIARILDISPHTVRNHIVVLMRLLGVSKRKLIVDRAIELGLIAPSSEEQDS